MPQWLRMNSTLTGSVPAEWCLANHAMDNQFYALRGTIQHASDGLTSSLAALGAGAKPKCPPCSIAAGNRYSISGAPDPRAENWYCHAHHLHTAAEGKRDFGYITSVGNAPFFGQQRKKNGEKRQSHNLERRRSARHAETNPEADERP